MNPPLAILAEAFIDWLTDVTNYDAAKKGLQISWGVSALELPFDAMNFWNNKDIVIALLPPLFASFPH